MTSEPIVWRWVKQARCLSLRRTRLPRYVSRTVSGQTPATAGNTENVILVTLDGARTQEIFGGLNEDILPAR